MEQEPLGLTLENDGEVRVFIPLRLRPYFGFKTYSHAQIQRRIGGTKEGFRERYPVIDGAEEKKAELFDSLGVTPEELRASMQRASEATGEYRSLMKLVNDCRKERKVLKVD